MFAFQRRLSVLVGVAALCLFAVGEARAQTPPVAPPPSDPAPTTPGLVEILQDKPTFYVRADVQRASRRYREGEAIELSVVSEQDAYLYVLYQQADGKAVQIYPNSGTADNRISARQPVSIPGPNDRFTWIVGAPFGEEIIKVIASKEPLAKLDDPRLRERLFPAVEDSRLRALAVELQSETPVAWGTDQISLKTFAKEVVPDAPTGRRFGVFFGVSEYEHDKHIKLINPNSGLQLGSPHKDVRRMVAVMEKEGRLDGVRAFINDQATKKNLELMVTQWLPSVSQPGDTVFIYFSSHGGQIPDNDGDEKDGKDEYLVPYDFIRGDAMQGIIKRIENKDVDADLIPAAQKVMDHLKRSGGKFDDATFNKAALALARDTGVTDDLFGHWAQRLAGRQVIVIIDTCHSGGLSSTEKSLRAPAEPASFDFLDGEFGRLKDLGQRDTALIAACGSAESAQESGALDGGVFTYHFAEFIEKHEGATTLEKAHEACRKDIALWFEKTNAAKVAAGLKPLEPHTPVLMNMCAKPVLLKP